MQIGLLEDLRQHTVQGIICVQKVYKGYRVRMQYKKLMKVTMLLQSSKPTFSLSTETRVCYLKEHLLPLIRFVNHLYLYVALIANLAFKTSYKHH